MTNKKENWDSDDNAVTSNWIKWNVPMEDKVFGTLISKRQIKSAIVGKENEMVNVYELKADTGSFHEVDDKKKLIETPITINAGEIWSIGGKAGIDAQMRNIKVGQKVGFKYTDEQPNKIKGYAPSKSIKIFAPKNDDGTPQMDMEWVEAQNTPDKQFGNF